jgi:hypothetical protein
MSYTTTDRTGTRFLIIHGTADDVVDPATQSQALGVQVVDAIESRRWKAPAQC